MTFRRGARLNPGQVNDQRGQSGGGGGGFPGGFQIPTGGRGGGGMGIPAGGGIGSIVVLLIIIGVIFFLRGGLGGGSSTDPGSGGLQQGPVSSNLASCQTGEDANNREDCRIVGYVNSVNAYWTQEYPQISGGKPYQEAQTTLFTDAYNT